MLDLNMVIIKAHPGISPPTLEAHEARYGRRPDDYRQFLLRNNGLELIDSAVVKVAGIPVDIYLSVDSILGAGVPSDEIATLSEEEEQEIVIPKGFHCVAASGGGWGLQYIMSDREGDFGKVYYFDPHSEDPSHEPKLVAESFSQFFGNIVDCEPGNRESETLFRILHERHLKRTAEWEALMRPTPKKPWWKFW